MKKIVCMLAIVALMVGVAVGADTFVPYTAETVPDNVVDLWKGVDARKDALETEVVKEWVEEGVTCRYVIFKVGTFKGADSRIAAFYTFPEGAQKVPAIVWAHGGGQRATLAHGLYFAKHGYAMVDINWGGREILEGIDKNTDWGAIDPTQGPKFYPGAKRKSTKSDFLPDEYTIDPVISPRNGNWFMLAYAGRRAITFLENQSEVDADRIGFTGFSMGGNITSYVSIDPRLKAVVPMVGGAGFITTDSAGLPESGRSIMDHSELFANTMESQSYYPHTQCPVLLLSASDDFHSRFEFIYQCMDVLPHDHWRVSQNIHMSHNLGADQWIMMNRWFDRYLKEAEVEIAKTPESSLEVDAENGSAVFTITPESGKKLVAFDVYYSHDPNEKSRFWIKANAVKRGGTWKATLPVRENLPLFVFGNCAYPLEEPVETFQGTATTYSITSSEKVYLPETIKAETFFSEAKPTTIFSNIKRDGFADWGCSQGGLRTYKFRDPRMVVPSPDAKLKLTLNVPRQDMSLNLIINKNHYITGVREPKATYSFKKPLLEARDGTVLILLASDFKGSKEKLMTDWSNISIFKIDLYDGKLRSKLNFKDSSNHDVISKIEWLTP